MRTRRNSVGLWLSDAELTHLRQQCQITGLNTNTYLRKLIMGEHLCPRPPDAYAALLRELSAIGNNINQIAHWDQHLSPQTYHGRTSLSAPT
ncbi:putative uncharacterized protein [Firmicutes bacterium CAG:124]|nr:putative uncharacterized protein [Firmicutes bacterium CAG:124]